MTIGALPARFAFRPRYRALSWSAVGLGVGLTTIGAVAGVFAPIVVGVIGSILGSMYLASPAWRLEVVVDEVGLVVQSAQKTFFRLPWTEVVRVIAAANATCFVDGGASERSLIVPGVGAVAPYDLADKEALFDLIMAHVPADKVERVETLEAALAERAARIAAAGRPPAG